MDEDHGDENSRRGTYRAYQYFGSVAPVPARTLRRINAAERSAAVQNLPPRENLISVCDEQRAVPTSSAEVDPPSTLCSDDELLDPYSAGVQPPNQDELLASRPPSVGTSVELARAKRPALTVPADGGSPAKQMSKGTSGAECSQSDAVPWEPWEGSSVEDSPAASSPTALGEGSSVEDSLAVLLPDTQSYAGGESSKESSSDEESDERLSSTLSSSNCSNTQDFEAQCLPRSGSWSSDDDFNDAGTENIHSGGAFHCDEYYSNQRFVRVARELHLGDVNCDEDIINSYSAEKLRKALLILATKMRHNLTYVATENVVELAGVLSDCTFPESNKYFWKKIIHSFAKGMSVHHVCCKCFEYVGVAQCSGENKNDFDLMRCPSCETEFHPKTNVKAGNVFIYVSLGRQIQTLLEVCKEQCDYRECRVKNNVYAIEDIYDGQFYKKCVKDDMISVNFSCDGAPVFDSSNYQIHPLLCTINELEPKKRREYVMLCGLWFGEGKPKVMNAFLTPFVVESQFLFNKGVTFSCNGIEKTVRVKVLMGVSDSVERPVLRCSTQFNGLYGCGLCLHPGVEVPKGKGKVRVYPLKDADGVDYPATARTHDSTLLHAVAKQYGIKEKSILCDIPGFDIISCLDVDWPHAVLFGVARQFANLMFNSNFKEKPYSISKKIKKVDEFLLSIKPTLEISRTPRKMSDRVHWKMHEWAIWVLFYSIPTLNLFITNRQYFHHWALLVDAISILTKSSIMKSEIHYSEQCLRSFIDSIPSLYGIEHVSFNVHLLSHLPQSVLNFGCLWTHSSFIYEDFNQDLLSYVKSSYGVGIQVCDSFRTLWAVKHLEFVCSDNLTEKEKEYLSKLLRKNIRLKSSLTVNAASLLGTGKPSSLTDNQYHALQRLGIKVNRGHAVYHYERAIIRKEIVQTQQYTKVSKRNSYVVLTVTGDVFEISSFVVFDVETVPVCYALGRYFEKQNQSCVNDRRLNQLIVLGKRDDQMGALSVENIQEKVTIIESARLNCCFACVHPNHEELLS